MSNKDKKRHLSYSGYSTYVTCPKKYEYNYIQKIRPESQPAHLLFGSATDAALNEILLGNSKTDALIAANIELIRLSKEKIDLESKDYDGELITEETEKELLSALRSKGWTGSDYNQLAHSLFQKVNSGEPLSENQGAALKTLVWYSFLEKISLIIDAFETYVRPQIEEVVSVQEYVKRGILDFKAKLKGIDGIVLCDNKTASRDYEPDAVKMSVQLAGYGAEVGAYIVFNKNVKKNRIKTCSVCGNNGTGGRHKTCNAEVGGKRCEGDWDETVQPEIIPQIIIDEVPEHNRLMVEEAYSETEKLIECGSFPRNLNNCGKQFGRPCEYINLCWHGSMKGLTKKDESK